MRVLLLSFILLLLLAGVGYGGYRLYLVVQQKRTDQKAATTSSPYNPFAEDGKGALGSFGGTSGSKSAPVNPFAEPTAAYQNPFSTTPAGSQSYKNPFEALR